MLTCHIRHLSDCILVTKNTKRTKITLQLFSSKTQSEFFSLGATAESFGAAFLIFMAKSLNNIQQNINLRNRLKLFNKTINRLLDLKRMPATCCGKKKLCFELKITTPWHEDLSTSALWIRAVYYKKQNQLKEEKTQTTYVRWRWVMKKEKVPIRYS